MCPEGVLGEVVRHVEHVVVAVRKLEWGGGGQVGENFGWPGE